MRALADEKLLHIEALIARAQAVKHWLEVAQSCDCTSVDVCALFVDPTLEIVDLIAEGEKVAGRFHCSATNLGPWRGKPPTGRRFQRVNEVYIFRVHHGRIAEAWGLEDTRSRERQLGHSH